MILIYYWLLEIGIKYLFLVNIVHVCLVYDVLLLVSS
jgi:hypothetical protein